MPRLDDDAHAFWLDDLLHGFCDLLGELLLDLQAAGEDIYHTRDFAKADDLVIWDIGYVHASEKRQQMMLAKALKFDIAHEYHFVVGAIKQRVV